MNVGAKISGLLKFLELYLEPSRKYFLESKLNRNVFYLFLAVHNISLLILNSNSQCNIYVLNI